MLVAELGLELLAVAASTILAHNGIIGVVVVVVIRITNRIQASW